MSEEQSVEAPPVRVPNVSPGARSGLDHQVIGSNAQEAYDANEALNPESTPDVEPVVIPEDLTTVDALMDWIEEPDPMEEQVARARAVLAAEKAKPEDDQRVTLVEPLEAHLEAYDTPQE